jgi:hypothetical protein
MPQIDHHRRCRRIDHRGPVEVPREWTRRQKLISAGAVVAVAVALTIGALASTPPDSTPSYLRPEAVNEAVDSAGANVVGSYYGLSHFGVDCLARTHGESKMLEFIKLTLREQNGYDKASRRCSAPRSGPSTRPA